jgi:hypothetical protein
MRMSMLYCGVLDTDYDHAHPAAASTARSWPRTKGGVLAGRTTHPPCSEGTQYLSCSMEMENSEDMAPGILRCAPWHADGRW